MIWVFISFFFFSYFSLFFNWRKVLWENCIGYCKYSLYSCLYAWPYIFSFICNEIHFPWASIKWEHHGSLYHWQRWRVGWGGWSNWASPSRSSRMLWSSVMSCWFNFTGPRWPACEICLQEHNGTYCIIMAGFAMLFVWLEKSFFSTEILKIKVVFC